ncbi:MAG: asparagine--tRNA ligase [Oscillospiraceae bacterium]|jgi:asparaginyl-tRNA synthetase|nr:asparagine--tRNA ligase [Oscillospiraceae bacterium]
MIHGVYTDVAALGSAPAGEVRVRGYVRTSRFNAHVGFIELNDGTQFYGAQVVCDLDTRPGLAAAAKYATGSSLDVAGELVFTPEARQPFEIRAASVTLVGDCDADYPMQKKRHTLEFMREMPHLRVRTNTFSALFRVRNCVSMAIHEYLQSEGFMWVATPILTGNDAEGAGETFGVTADSSAGDGGFFGKPASLTVSGQLHVEPFALAFDRAYTFGPTFRAENSNTTTHAAEFWMVEPELSYADLEDDMEVMEGLVRFVTGRVLERCPDETAFFNDRIDETHTLTARLAKTRDTDFRRMTYTEAVELLEKSGRDFKYPVKWGLDLKTEHERYLCEEVAQSPLFLTDYPKDIKAFYMRLNPDGKTVAACDLLVPGVGELIGGSQREERYGELIRRMNEVGIPVESLSWYADLRRFGSVPHAGFGLGLERFLLYVTAIGNIRDTLPYARTPGNMVF